MILRHEARAWIGAETEWECPEPAPLHQPAPDAGADAAADLRLDMTLTRRVIKTRGPADDIELNDFYLRDEAFVPKKFSARLERGCFDTAMEEKLGAVPRWAPKYKYRFVFDKSPYPQAQEWKEVDEDDQYLLP